MPWLELLIGLLAFGAGWVGCAVFETVVPERRGSVDFTAAAARGELLHLDWGDQRSATLPATGATISSAEMTGRTLETVRHLRSVD